MGGYRSECMGKVVAELFHHGPVANAVALHTDAPFRIESVTY